MEASGNSTKGRDINKKYTKSFLTTETYNCVMCDKHHLLQECEVFKGLSPAERSDRIRQLRFCLNCLRKGHFIQNCRAKRCGKCNGRHHTMLHFENIGRDKPVSAETSANDVMAAVPASNSAVLSCIEGVKQVLLATAHIYIKDNCGRTIKLRAVLDPGSQSSFIREEIVNKLDLKKRKIECNISSINMSTFSAKFVCHLDMFSIHNSYNTQIYCLVVPRITEYMPNFPINTDNLNIPLNLKMADTTFNEPGEIDVLIGGECYWELLCVGQIKLGPGKPILQKTRLGWVVAGAVGLPQAKKISCNFSKNNLNDQLAKFWELEECSGDRRFSAEEKLCEEHFINTYRRDTEGRFIVTIPFKENPNVLGDSRVQAERRFYALERKFKKDDMLKNRYREFMREYECLGHMSMVVDGSNMEPSYFMPHHGVIKEASSSTKLRAVFDGSCVSSSGISLNDLQYVGATIQEELFQILLRFRKYAYVISADIEKMYRQVLVNPEQRNLQQILWRDNPEQELKTYALNTLTYGTTSAPFLAIRCLQQLASDIEDINPAIAEIIKKDFYVDDLLTGADTIGDAMAICEQMNAVLQSGCFHLRKWLSNEPVALQSVESRDNSTNVLEFDADSKSKMLGLIWCFRLDNLIYNIREFKYKKVTKRSVLSEIAQIFDPLGLVAPVTVLAKITMQKLWQSGISWDESLPSELHTEWCRFRSQLITLNKLTIPRRVVCHNYINIQLHGFADASERAYGGCIYIRSENASGNVCVNLLCAKSRVAPLKSTTIPRLELCACLILVRLVKKVMNSMRVKFDMCRLWTDSTIALGWIKSNPVILKQFVNNRVCEIQESSDKGNWSHVPGKDNPADYLSRGISPDSLSSTEVWWNGPQWLRESIEHWPKSVDPPENLPEAKENTSVLVSVNSEKSVFPFERYSGYSKMLRSMAYCLRFIKNCRLERTVGTLTCDELRLSKIQLLKLSQMESFGIDLKSLKSKDCVSSKSKLATLNPFLDDSGLIRVGGRIKNSNFDFNKKHPVVVASDHHFIKQIFAYEHAALLHAGPQLLLSHIREELWPISGRNLARKTLFQCVKCFKAKPKPLQPIMGNLPEGRVSPSPPFHIVGIDYAGPFIIKDRKGRGSKQSKCYLCLFVCFATKAVHLEIVSDLTTEGFLLSFRRFVARRGKPLHVYSDNGTNFVGAKTELERLSKFFKSQNQQLTEVLATENISWHFIPPHAPHFGGLWEAAVRCTKFHLKRVMSNEIFTFEEMYTLMVQIEAILNSRPLTPLSSDPNDLNPLTPAHFLIGRSLLSAPDPDVRDIPISRLSRFQHLQQLSQHLWSRWSKEYISQLQQRYKWHRNQSQVEEDSMVVVKEDNLPSCRWLLGRVVQLHPGKDGVNRVASIRTVKGVIRRPLVKICPLPIE